MFKITGMKGFHLTFENGYTVSVQFGPGNYCDNYDRDIGVDEKLSGEVGSNTAECAVWGRDSKMIKRDGWSDTVNGYMTSANVLELMNWASKQK